MIPFWHMNEMIKADTTHFKIHHWGGDV